ncbi:MAG: hypothetical protein V4637_13665 [Pseudomonadota bacterium]
MDWLVTLLLVFAALAVAALILKKRLSDSGAGNEPWPLSVKKPLTIPEQVLYHRFVIALPEYIVPAQVQLSRILEGNKGVPRTAWLADKDKALTSAGVQIVRWTTKSLPDDREIRAVFTS